ncbi:MAG: hypothetical protein R3A10_21220 [Caldilineaceae bacterium]
MEGTPLTVEPTKPVTTGTMPCSNSGSNQARQAFLGQLHDTAAAVHVVGDDDLACVHRFRGTPPATARPPGAARFMRSPAR